MMMTSLSALLPDMERAGEIQSIQKRQPLPARMKAVHVMKYLYNPLLGLDGDARQRSLATGRPLPIPS